MDIGLKNPGDVRVLLVALIARRRRGREEGGAIPPQRKGPVGQIAKKANDEARPFPPPSLSHPPKKPEVSRPSMARHMSTGLLTRQAPASGCCSRGGSRGPVRGFIGAAPASSASALQSTWPGLEFGVWGKG